MANPFNTASGSQPYTTAGDLAAELGKFAKDLGETADKLRTEIDNIQQSQSQINDELAFTAGDFVKKTLTELEGEGFDTINTIAQNTEELGTQSLKYFRHTLMENRDEALQRANDKLDKTVDAADFQDTLGKARDNYDAASKTARDAQSKLETAQQALSDWEDNSVEDDLVRLNDGIKEKGGVALTSDNRAYYEPTGFTKLVRWFVGGSSYRAVRRALKEYGHGVDGKDAFADLSGFQAKYDEFNAAIEAAQGEYDAAHTAQAKEKETIDLLSDLADDIKTDDKLLAAVQDKVIEDLKQSPEFIKAMADHYAEDFPRALPLMVAKLNTLSKLENGTEQKLEAVQQNLLKVSDQARKLERLRHDTRVKADLGQVSKRNAARLAEYNHYADSAGRSWRRTRDFSYDDYYSHRGTTVYVDNSPSFFETMLIYNMLSSHDHYYYNDYAPRGGDLSSDAAFTAGLVGVDKDNAADLGLPDETFDISDDVAQEMSDLGVDDYEPGSASFDLDDPDSPDNDTSFDIEQDEPDTSSSFDIGGDDRESSLSDTFGNQSDDDGGFDIGGDDDDDDRFGFGGDDGGSDDSFDIGGDDFGGGGFDDGGSFDL